MPAETLPLLTKPVHIVNVDFFLMGSVHGVCECRFLLMECVYFSIGTTATPAETPALLSATISVLQLAVKQHDEGGGGGGWNPLEVSSMGRLTVLYVYCANCFTCVLY